MNHIFTKKRIIILSISLLTMLVLIFFIVYIKGRNNIEIQNSIPIYSVNPAWADTTLKYMSLDEKIGQIILYDANNLKNSNYDSVLTIIHEVLPGGIEYSTDSLTHFIRVQNNLRKFSKINLLTFLKNDSGTFMFKDVEKFPNLLQIQAVSDDSTLNDFYNTWIELNKSLSVSGITAFSQKPTIIKDSSNRLFLNKLSLFNENAENKKITVFIYESDLIIPDSSEFEINSEILKSGISGVIINQNVKRKYDPFNLIKDLRIKYQFDGFLVVDSVIPDKKSIEKLLNSGVDILKTDNPLIIKKIIQDLISENRISHEQIDLSVRKILLAKTWTGLNQGKEIILTDVKSQFADNEHLTNSRSIFKQSITLIKNDKNILPFKSLVNKNVTVIDIGKSESMTLFYSLNKYMPLKYKFFDSNDKQFLKNISEYKKSGDIIFTFNYFEIDSTIINALKANNTARSNSLINFGNIHNLNYIGFFNSVLQFYGSMDMDLKNAGDAFFGAIKIKGVLPIDINSTYKKGFGLKMDKIRISECLPEEAELNSKILTKIDSIVTNAIRNGAFPGCQIVVLKNGYSVYNKAFGYHTYSNDKPVLKTDLYDLASVTKIAATTLAAMKMYDVGKLKLDDKLGKFFKDKSIDYSNLKKDTIFNIDTFYFDEINDFGKILKYQDTLRLNDSMFVAYDTLIIATTPKNNIFNVTVRDLLLHQSGITPTLPILPYLLYKKYYYDSSEQIKLHNIDDTAGHYSMNDNKSNLKKIFDQYFTRKYIKDSATVKIADNFYLQDRYFDTLWRDTKRLRIYSRKIYQYSDINMILLQMAIDSLNRTNINHYLRTNFYIPMGLSTMCYLPSKYFNSQRIVPTENDKYWREQLLRGNVHDPSAAILGGISGNAGLFSSAYDLAVLGQMWLNGGTYGGVRYISETTVKKFTGFQNDSHRGLGFDKPSRKSIIGNGASPQSFGHTGFTGTCIWVDPVYEIVYVFLSNRVHPDSKNGKINKMQIRQKIHSVVYESMRRYRK